MTFKEGVDAFLRFVELLTAWPVILLFALLIVRKEIRESLPELTGRLRRASIAGSEFEFSAGAVKAFGHAITAGAKQLRDDPEGLIGFLLDQVRRVTEATEVVGPSGQGSPSLAGRSILWVDDEPVNNAYEVRFFQQMGATVTAVNSTEDALSVLKGRSVDLIVSDVRRTEGGQLNEDAGANLQDALTATGIATPFIFYSKSIGRLDAANIGRAYGMADNSGQLLSLGFRVLTGPPARD